MEPAREGSECHVYALSEKSHYFMECLLLLYTYLATTVMVDLAEKGKTRYSSVLCYYRD